MKNTKTELRFFTVPEWKKEEEYLRKQHQDGWKFTRVGFPCFYHFESCEPEDVVYQLDYNPEGLSHMDEYIQMFRDCGWEHIQDFTGYSYFRKPVNEMAGEEEIFCDDSSRLEMIKRVWKGRMVPLLIVFFLLILPNLYVQSHIDSSANHALFVIYIILFLLYIILFLWFGYYFLKYWRSLHK